MDDIDYYVKTKVMEALIECRKERGLTQTEVGEIVGKKKTTVASWEQGKSSPDIATLARLAAYYKKTISYFFGEEENL